MTDYILTSLFLFFVIRPVKQSLLPAISVFFSNNSFHRHMSALYDCNPAPFPQQPSCLPMNRVQLALNLSCSTSLSVKLPTNIGKQMSRLEGASVAKTVDHLDPGTTLSIPPFMRSFVPLSLVAVVVDCARLLAQTSSAVLQTSLWLWANAEQHLTNLDGPPEGSLTRGHESSDSASAKSCILASLTVTNE
ncbi:hypothetical protein P691DRAFT_284816 [Macrolepiota fuliginosa MF-IS2]|uniref:Uncharacterized protein n=1 Tax=Macrolepiota fuliginosa MF-IS2 TaxID=1400762 RepID=A0A9P5XMN4_9AGAR|nr:hypothetical protein P691DRAFT_284816 [Macrolepiota fuliginosa MF-IS2]